MKSYFVFAGTLCLLFVSCVKRDGQTENEQFILKKEETFLS